MKLKILFLSNKRSIQYTDGNGDEYSRSIQSGLSTSIMFIVDMLNDMGYDASYVQVDDSNGIDRVVTMLKPNVVMLEAVWVSPEKLAQLTKLHPKIQWNIRIHSEMPFLAHEGNALPWLIGCSKLPNVELSCNSNRMSDELGHALSIEMVYLPNYYGEAMSALRVRKMEGATINIGCFGAIRPMKNQLIQATAAILFADVENKPLQFHVNVNREETGGNSVLKNLRAIFDNHHKHKLIEHPWAPHDEFLKTIDGMDICMQVSMSESFNIVTADAVAVGVPVVVSSEIRWLSKSLHARPNSAENIAQRMIEIYYRMVMDGVKMMQENQDQLLTYNEHTKDFWSRFVALTLPKIK